MPIPLRSSFSTANLSFSNCECKIIKKILNDCVSSVNVTLNALLKFSLFHCEKVRMSLTHINK